MAYTYWRLNLQAWEGAHVDVAEVEMRASVGGADECTGGTPSVSSTTEGSAANIFDDNAATYWQSNGDASHWVQYQFGSAKDIVEIVLTTANYSDKDRYRTRYMDVQASNDGSSWTDIASFEASAYVRAPGQVEHFKIGGAKTYWRLKVLATTDGAATGYLEINEIEMRANIGSPLENVALGGGSPVNGVANCSNHYATYKPVGAFLQDGGTTWWGATFTKLTGEWIWFHFFDDIEIVEYAVTTTDNGSWVNNYSPRDFLLEYSGDGMNWTEAYIEAGINETSWSVGEQRVFTSPSAPPVLQLPQAYVEVMSTGLPALKVGQVYVEVMHKPAPNGLTDIGDLTLSVTNNVIHFVGGVVIGDAELGTLPVTVNDTGKVGAILNASIGQLNVSVPSPHIWTGPPESVGFFLILQ